METPNVSLDMTLICSERSNLSKVILLFSMMVHCAVIKQKVKVHNASCS